VQPSSKKEKEGEGGTRGKKIIKKKGKRSTSQRSRKEKKRGVVESEDTPAPHLRKKIKRMGRRE